MIEDLVRKIEHFHQYRLLQERNRFYREYLEDLYEEIEHEIDPATISLPIVIRTNYQRAADKLALQINEIEKNTLCFISLAKKGWEKRIRELNKEYIGYITHLEKLKKSERETLFEMLKERCFILTDSSETIETPFDTVTIHSSSKLYDQNDILTINEYVQYVVKTFQYKFPDTELSKKLGISRKSLWEKRKKYDLFKKK
jgi:DNA-binding NtrC family response regulator